MLDKINLEKLKTGFRQGMEAAEDYFPPINDESSPNSGNSEDDGVQRIPHFRLNYLFYLVSQQAGGVVLDQPTAAAQALGGIVENLKLACLHHSRNESEIEWMGYLCYEELDDARQAYISLEEQISDILSLTKELFLFGEASLISCTGYVTTPRSLCTDDRLLEVKEFEFNLDADVFDGTEMVC